MKTLKIEESRARQLYSNASIEFKAMLEDTFGKAFFSTDTRDYIKTLQDAINATGEELRINQEDTPDEVAYKKLKIIYKALNNDSKFPDYNNHNQYKYYPWVKPNPSGVGLSYGDYVYSRSVTVVGSRLVVGTSEEAEYIGKKFIKKYEAWVLF